MEKKDTSWSIARQSQSKLILEWAQSCGHCLTLPELVAMTELMAEYVVNGHTPEIKVRIKNAQQHLEGKAK